MKIIFLFVLLGLVHMKEHPGDELEPKPKRRNRNGPGTGSKLDWSFCTKGKPCGKGQGDCDSNDQCADGLECGVDNCRQFHPNAHRLADCCVPTKGRCVVDTPLRLLTHYVDLENGVTPERCIEACIELPKQGPEPKVPGYVHAGVEAGTQCWCGNGNISSVWDAPASECNTPCSGDPNEICGGKWRMNLFETGISLSDNPVEAVKWKKVFGHNFKGGFFSNLEETKKKNANDENALLFSILYNLEAYRMKKGHFHFKLCYPELTQFPNPCNEWTQTSNPVLESKITGYKAVNITWDTDSYGGPFRGLGLSPASKNCNLIDDAPDRFFFWSSIGTMSCHPSWQENIPGPLPHRVLINALYVRTN